MPFLVPPKLQICAIFAILEVPKKTFFVNQKWVLSHFINFATCLHRGDQFYFQQLRNSPRPNGEAEWRRMEQFLNMS